MSTIEMKHFINMFCRLVDSLRDSEFICHEFMEDALHIKDSLQKMKMPYTKPAAEALDANKDDDHNHDLIDDDQVQKLLNENEEMKCLLSDYHRGIELMMIAYRERVLKNMKEEEEKLNLEKEFNLYDKTLVDIIMKQSDQIYQMHLKMRKAANINEDAEYLANEQMSYLRKENVVLREIYETSKQFGTAQNRLRFNELNLKEIAIQTDEEMLEKKQQEENTNEEELNDPYWKNFEAWKKMFKREKNVFPDADDDDDDDDEGDGDDDVVTVVDFEKHNKSKALNKAAEKV